MNLTIYRNRYMLFIITEKRIWEINENAHTLYYKEGETLNDKN